MKPSNVDLDTVSPQLAVTKANLRTTSLLDRLDRLSPRPLLADVLDEIGPLPKGSIFLGKAEDGLPVLLDCQDPRPGPILILGNPNSGKTDFLRVTAKFVISTQTPVEIQFAVITEQIEEWHESLANSRHCIGVFANDRSDVRRLVKSLAAWISIIKRPGQAILIFLDGLQQILQWDPAMLSCLQRIFAYGPEKQVWPIVTLTPLQSLKLDAWLKFFQLRIVADDLIDQDSDCQSDSSFVHSPRLVNAPWFSLQENTRRIGFWIPALGY